MFNIIKSMFTDIFLISRIISSLVEYVYSLFNITFKNSWLTEEEEKVKKMEDTEKKAFFNYGAKNVREYYALNFLKKDSFKQSDILWSKFLANKYLIKKNNTNLFRSYFRILSTNQGFFFNFKKLKNIKLFNVFLMNTFLSGFKFIWLGLRFWVFPLLIFFSVIYFTLVLRALPFNKVVFSWLCILMFVYWLISGFVFFF